MLIRSAQSGPAEGERARERVTRYIAALGESRGGVENEQGKRSVPGNQSQALRICVFHTADVASNQSLVASYLITPRCDVSMNRIKDSISSPCSPSERSFSSACEVFSFDASSTL